MTNAVCRDLRNVVVWPVSTSEQLRRLTCFTLESGPRACHAADLVLYFCFLVSVASTHKWRYRLSSENQHFTYRYFDLCLVVFVACLLTANVIAVKLVAIGPLVLPAAVIVFPVSYIVGDVLTEVYGLERARRAIWLGFMANLIMVLAIVLGQWLPPASMWDAQLAYERILGYSPRLLLASFAGYLAGEFANSYVMSWMSTLTRGQWLWTRTIGSTVVGQALDSLVFITIAFVGTMPAAALITTIITQWLFKVIYEALATPMTYAIIAWLKRTENTTALP